MKMWIRSKQKYVKERHIFRVRTSNDVGFVGASDFTEAQKIIDSPEIIGCNELFTDLSRPLRMFFDIDGLAMFKEVRFIKEFKEVVGDVFNSIGLLKRLEYAIFRRVKNDTLSFHIHILNYFFFDDPHIMRFIRKLGEIINKKLTVHDIDLSVYRKNGSLRLPFFEKVDNYSGESEVFEQIEPKKMRERDFSLCAINNCVNANPSYDPLWIYSHKKGRSLYDRLNDIYLDTFRDVRYFEELSKGELKYIEDSSPILKMIKDVVGTDWKCLACSNFITVTPIDRQKTSIVEGDYSPICPCCGGKHDSDNWSVFKTDNDSILLYCFRGCGNKVLLKGDGKIKDTRYMEHAKSMTHIKGIIDFEEEHISDNFDSLSLFKRACDIGGLHISIRAPMGSGKSYFSIKLIKELVPMGCKILIIAPLRLLCKKLFIDVLAKVERSSCYQNSNYDLNHHDVFITTPESILNLSSSKFDVIIYDEITTIISSLPGKTMKERIRYFRDTNKVLQDSSILSIACDAHIENISSELVYGKKIEFYNNSIDMNIGRVHVLKNNANALDTMRSMIRAKLVMGKKIAFCSDSAKIVTDMANYILSLNFDDDFIREREAIGLARLMLLTIRSPKMSDELAILYAELGMVEASLANKFNEAVNSECIRLKKVINERLDKKEYDSNMKEYYRKIKELAENEKNPKFWAKWDVVLYSPSVKVGLDFNNTGFDTLFSIFNGNSVDYQEATQMMRRFRDIRGDSFVTLFKCKKKNWLIPATMREANKLDPTQIAHNFNINSGVYSGYDDRYQTVIKSVMVKKKASEGNFKEMFLHCLAKQGITENEEATVDVRVDDKVDEKEDISTIVDDIPEFQFDQEVKKCIGYSRFRAEVIAYRKRRDSSTPATSLPCKSLFAIFILTQLFGVDLESEVEDLVITTEEDRTIRLAAMRDNLIMGDCDIDYSDPITTAVLESLDITKEQLMKKSVLSIFNIFFSGASVYSCKDDKIRVSNGKVTTKLNQMNVDQFYQSLGYHSLIGFDVDTERVTVKENGKTTRMRLKEVFVRWNSNSIL